MKKQQKKEFKQVQNQAQEGRSMVEMIGVLAIIGVLSVGSLSGYEYATASYRAGQIRDALLTAKKSASINTSASYTNEVKRLLKGYLPSYNVNIEETSSGQYHYQVQLTGIAPRTCTHLWEMKNVLDSFSITMTNPTSKNGCQLDNASVDTVSMSFAFNALDNKTDGGSSDPSCADCKPGFCISGVCVECLTSADCEDSNQVCDEQAGKCTDDCSKGVCQTGHCIQDESNNHRCGECADPTPKWNGKNCVACPPSAPQWNGVDCEALEVETTTPITESTTPETTTTEATTTTVTTTTVTTTTQPKSCEDLHCADDEFCLSSSCSYACSNSQMTEEDSCENGTYKCEKIDSYKAKNKDSKHPDKYVMTKDGKYMNWWSAERFCKALGRKMVTISELECQHRIQYGGDCKAGYCHDKNSTQTCTGGSNTDLSEVVKELRRAKSGGDGSSGSGSLWLYDAYTNTTSSSNSCDAYDVGLSNGRVAYANRHLRNFALCE